MGLKQVDGVRGLRFLAAVAVAYLFVALISYSLFMTAGPLITANAVINLQEDESLTSSQKINENAGLNKAIYIASVIFVTVLFIWIIAYLFSRRTNKEIKHEIPKYRAFKTR
jgi:surface polysaccharide O-acyltransferase-like enzyme